VGIKLGSGHVRESTIEDNLGFGVEADSSSGISENVIKGNNGGGNVDQLGDNVVSFGNNFCNPSCADTWP
jgi:hypothetical protein